MILFQIESERRSFWRLIADDWCWSHELMHTRWVNELMQHADDEQMSWCWRSAGELLLQACCWWLSSGTNTEFHVPDLRSQAAIMGKFRAFLLNLDFFRTTFLTFSWVDELILMLTISDQWVDEHKSWCWLADEQLYWCWTDVVAPVTPGVTYVEAYHGPSDARF